MTHKKSPTKHKSPFPPFSIAFCGDSGSGKTTLIEKLIHIFSTSYSVGYIKHDAHQFEIDKAGKDTYRAKHAGATHVCINSEQDFATMGNYRPSPLDHPWQALLSCNFCIVEGYKTSELPKILFVSTESHCYQEFLKGTWENVIALITIDDEANLTTNTDSIQHNSLPIFHRNEEEKIASFVLTYFNQHRPILNGLILLGGHSSRMGTPKHLLKWGGNALWEKMQGLLQPYCHHVYFSIRPNQPLPAGLPTEYVIEDEFLNIGPMGGILTAIKRYPQESFCVLACDMPLLSHITLLQLFQNRNFYQAATVFRNPINQYIEPLCAIYEPKFYTYALKALMAQIHCPRHTLKYTSKQELNPISPRELSNTNTPEDWNTLMQESN